MLSPFPGDDTEANVQRLCLKASKPFRKDILEAMEMQNAGITVGAVCVYPSRYFEYHNKMGIPFLFSLSTF